MAPKPMMSAKELHADLAKRAGISQRAVRALIAGLRDVAGERLSLNGAFSLPGICTFRVRTLPPRPQPRNQKVFGKDVTVPSRGALKTVRVSASKILRDKADP